tara:strand:+ start:63 stop:242 length:180 start_codon:yes stop_codon:yes gene_type:complete
MQEDFGIGDKVSFSLGKAQPKKKSFLNKVINVFTYIPKKIVKRIKKAITDEEHPVNSHN